MATFDTMPPLREGLLQLQPPRLVGAHCTHCSIRMFPARAFCTACGQDAPESTVLADKGVVFSYTVIHTAPGNRPVPYVLAYVDLDDGVRVMAQVDSPPDEVHIGQRVSLILRNIVPHPGEPRLGYAFVGQADHNNAQETS